MRKKPVCPEAPYRTTQRPALCNELEAAFTGFPIFIGPNSAIVSAAAALGNDALLSHESALKLYDVCDVRPSGIHFTVSRNRRYTRPPQADVEIHTTSQPIDSLEQVQFEGFRATSLARSIVDSAKNGTAPEQIVMAVREGLNRGLLSASELKRAMKTGAKRVAQLIHEGERSETRWICRDLPYPPNFWELLPAETREAIMSERAGARRLAILFERVQKVPIARATVQGICQQDDPMKRVRRNGGARDYLGPKGIAILFSGNDRELIAALGLPPLKDREFISFTPKTADQRRMLWDTGHID